MEPARISSRIRGAFWRLFIVTVSLAGTTGTATAEDTEFFESRVGRF